MPATLDEPLILPCGQTLPNRFMKSALSEALGSPNGAPNAQLDQLFATWGAGGYGLIVTGNVMIDRRHLGEPGNVVIEDDRHHNEFARWAESARGSGTPIWMQINHPGRQSNPFGRTRLAAPSPIALKVPGARTPHELTGSEIDEIIGRYATAADVAEKAGFDGVQIHDAHGYLVSQFLSPLSNQRTDEWGGSPERRMAFVLAVLARIVNTGATVLSKITDPRALNSLLDLQWHTDQLHRIGAGKQPDLDRPSWKTGVSMVRRNGRDILRRKRT